MKTIAHALALTLASLAVVAVAAGCSSEAPPTFGDDDDTVMPSKKKTETDDSADKNQTKSNTEAPPPPVPTPTPSATPAPPPPPPPPPVDTKPAVDPLACSNLGQCCSKITNIYGQLGCLAVQLRGDPETCAKSLIACLAAVGLSGGGGGACIDSTDCPGTQRCINRVCQ
jgi:hypothetical protein